MKPTVAVLYGDAGSASLIHALKAWRAEHAPQAPYDALFAEYITRVIVETELRPGGVATIHVQVRGRRRTDFEQYWFEATVTGGELKLESITD